MGMDYSKIEQWILREDSFDPAHLGKCEAVLSLGNGYLGLRSALEEKYLGETRDLLVNGTFNQCDPTSVTELPNAADMTAVELWVDGERFALDQGTLESYSRELNIRDAELTREVTWTAGNGAKLELKFQRVVSLKHLHDFAIKVTVKPVNRDVTLRVRSGIDGQVTNTGSQHFTDGNKRFYEGRYVQYVPVTTQSDITFCLNTVHKFTLNGEPRDLPTEVNMDLRKVYGVYELDVPQGGTFVLEKFCNVFTSRDLDAEGKTTDELMALALEDVKALEAIGYDTLAQQTAEEWAEEVWDRVPITIEGNAYDQFAVRFAQYHMRLMVPAHDSRMNIGAKGLAGEGYRGHCFWDTEIFLLPYYMFETPEIARKLEEYRYYSLPGAHKKAKANGYDGAMFPWESGLAGRR